MPIVRMARCLRMYGIQVVPALDPKTPIFAAGFAMELIKKRLQEFNLWDESRFRTFTMRERFELGPFECVPLRCPPRPLRFRG